MRRAIDRFWPIAISVLGLWLAVLLVSAARTKPFWHDEIYTVLLSRLSIGDLWRASRDGVDLNPPLSVAAVRAVHAAVEPGPVATRLPAMAGFLAAVAFVFLIVRRRTNAAVAFASAAALAFTEAWRYALEARAYGLTLGLGAAAWYAWSEAAAGRSPARHWTIMSAAVALGVWAHYYAILVALPIVVGEIVRQAARRRVDWRPWAALAAAAVATLPLLPLVLNASAQRATFWARPQTIDVAGIYAFLRAGFELPAIAAVLLAGLAIVESIRRVGRREWPRRVPAHEAAAGLAALALPAAAVLLGHWIGAFDRRYAILAAVGLAIAVPVLVWMLTPESGAGDLVMLATAIVLLAQLGGNVLRDPPQWRHPYASRQVLADWLRGPRPVVVTGGVDYLALWYYAPAEARSRVLYLADPEFQLRDTGTDTSDRGYLALARWFDVPVVRIEEFLRSHESFWLYSFGADWVERSLKQRGARFVERAPEPSGEGRLVEVFMR
jgi:hypothetical protein